MSIGDPIKQNGVKQRKDTVLDFSIANAIRNHILSGKNIYNKNGYIKISKIVDGVEKPFKISTGTINSWITRGNVINEIGDLFKDFVNQAKEDYRLKIKEERKDKLVEMAEAKLNRIMNIRTNVAVRDKDGKKIIDEDTGKVLRRENSRLLAIQLNALKFTLERLDKVNYGKAEENSVKAHFDLSELRKYRDDKN